MLDWLQKCHWRRIYDMTLSRFIITSTPLTKKPWRSNPGSPGISLLEAVFLCLNAFSLSEECSSTCARHYQVCNVDLKLFCRTVIDGSYPAAAAETGGGKGMDRYATHDETALHVDSRYCGQGHYTQLHWPLTRPPYPTTDSSLPRYFIADHSAEQSPARSSTDNRCKMHWTPNAWVTWIHARFEVFTAVTMKNAVFWGVTSCCSCWNDVLEERIASFIRVTSRRPRKNVSSN
jgi:hypothetical protein